MAACDFGQIASSVTGCTLPTDTAPLGHQLEMPIAQALPVRIGRARHRRGAWCGDRFGGCLINNLTQGEVEHEPQRQHEFGCRRPRPRHSCCSVLPDDAPRILARGEKPDPQEEAGEEARQGLLL